jgi:transcriptional regulator with XRE-family HTH domain
MDEYQFGAKIRIRREELGLSQNELGMALKIDQGKVSLMEKGQRRLDVVKELPILAKLLKVPVGWFFEETEAPKKESPIEALVKQYFPDVQFTDFEMKRISQFLEPVVESYIKSDPKLGKKISGS